MATRGSSQSAKSSNEDDLAVRTAVAEATAVRETAVEVRQPLARIAVHGVFAATTILLVVLAAVGAG